MLTSSDLNGYATESWVNSEGFATETWLKTKDMLNKQMQQHTGYQSKYRIHIKQHGVH